MNSNPMTIAYDSVQVNVRGEPLHEVIWQGRQWAVTTYGLECRDGCYCIEAKRLTEDMSGDHPYSWIKHVGGKSWADMDDFSTAFFVACAVHGHRLSKRNVELLVNHYSVRTAQIAERAFL
jgi:hypothetical protein